MRKVTKLAVNAFFNKKAFSLSNTTVFINENGTVFLTLHGNNIAMLNKEGKLFISNAGWHTRTTSERLNGVLTHYKKDKVFIKNHIMYYKDKETFLNDRWLEV